MTHPRINKRLQEERKLIFGLTIGLILIVIAGEVFISRKTQDTLLSEASTLLTPLPPQLKWESLDVVMQKLDKIPISIDEFLDSLDKKRINVLDDTKEIDNNQNLGIN